MQDSQVPSLNSIFKGTSLLNQFPHQADSETTYCPVIPLLTLVVSSVSMGIAWQEPVSAKTSSGLSSSHLVLSLPSLENRESLPNSTLSFSIQQRPASSSFSTVAGDRIIPRLPSLTIAQAKTKATDSKLYTVKPGDTVAGIARQHGISSNELVELNQINDPNFIKVNRQLLVPPIRIAQEETYKEVRSDFRQIVKTQKATESTSNRATSFTSIVEKKAQLSPKKKRPSENLEIKEDPIAVNPVTKLVDNDSSNGQDPYINRLRQDIVKLRDKYQNQSGNEVITALDTSVSTPTSQNKVVESDIQSIGKLEPTKILTSPTPEEATATNSSNKVELGITNQSSVSDLVTLAPQAAIAPQLPPLSNSEEYLPDNPVFNGYMWPAKGTLTSGYGWRWGRMHKGIDIAAPIGTPIIAAASGEVIFSGWNTGGYGNLVKLKHRDGSVTLYAHNNKNLVRKGQKVRQGQLIAEMGSTGRSTGPHLHFEIRPNGLNAVNPMAKLPRR